MVKKIAIPTNGTNVDDHFGHCQYYTIYTINDDNSINNRELLASPAGCGCKSDIAQLLAEMDVKVMVAGNMGEGAYNKLTGAGLEVYRGFSGRVEIALNSYLKGFRGDERMCEAHLEHKHGDHNHSCSH